MQIFGSRLLVAIQSRGYFENITILSALPSANVPGRSRPPERSRCPGDLRRRCFSFRTSSAFCWGGGPPWLAIGHRHPNPAGNLNRPGQDKRLRSLTSWPRRSAAAICSSRPAISFQVEMDLSVPTAGIPQQFGSPFSDDWTPSSHATHQLFSSSSVDWTK
jgi:hypothetical protein